MRALDDLVKADKFDLGQFYAGAIEADRWEGKLWALPTVGHPGEVGIQRNWGSGSTLTWSSSSRR